jgi:transposase InsO family protein
MSQARLIITAVTFEGRSKSEVARDYGVSRYWVQTLVKRFRAEGEAAFGPRSRRPHTSPTAVTAAMEDQIVRLRKELSKRGLDAGADTIHTHLLRRTPRSKTSSAPQPPAVSTIWRVLTRRGFVTAQPHKRPKSSLHRFAAEQPNERWQADITHWQLADGTEVEILNIEDDHSRLDLASTTRRSFTAGGVRDGFRTAFKRYGIPERVLTDNAAVFTGKPRRGGQVVLEAELIMLRVRFDHSRAYHPQTCGKVERHHQTLKKWLASQPHQPTTLRQLQRLLHTYQAYYNTRRPHSALRRATPEQAWTTAPSHGGPQSLPVQTDATVHRLRVSATGTISIGRARIGVGTAHTGHTITAIRDGQHITVYDPNGHPLGHATLTGGRSYLPMTPAA